MSESLIIAKNQQNESVILLSNYANRHGLITGATGTGKTVTLQKIAESFSSISVPVFMADVKGDLSGIAVAGEKSEKLMQRLEKIGITEYEPQSNPTIFWDFYAENGHPVRATIDSLGAFLLSRLLDLNDVQSGVMQLIFKIANDNNLELIDLNDLRSLIKFIGENAKQFSGEYGNISSASIGAIQRSLLTLEEQGGNLFFGKPMLEISDLMRTNPNGKGFINILSAHKLYNSPKLYSTFLFWLLTQLYNQLPEVGDLPKPKLVFFFDEAHLLFNGAPKALLEKIEQIIRLIRSKGVGIFFISQNPLDIPETILGQLGNRVQHALRAFTPRDQKAVKSAAQTMRANPNLNLEEAIKELSVGEALISFLDEKGTPSITERSFVIAPNSRMGILTDSEMQTIINSSPVSMQYNKTFENKNSQENLQKWQETITNDSKDKKQNEKTQEENSGLTGWFKTVLFGKTGPRGGKKDGLVQSTGKSVVRKVTNKIGTEIVNSIFGKKR